MKRIFIYLIIIIAFHGVIYAAPSVTADLDIGFDLGNAEDISIGFSSEPVLTINQDIEDISGRTMTLESSLATLTASLAEPVYLYAQILYSGNCSVSVSAAPLSGGNERLGWDIGTDGEDWLSVAEEDAYESHVVWKHEGSAENLASVHSAPLSIVTHSFDGKASATFSGQLTVTVDSDPAGGSV